MCHWSLLIRPEGIRPDDHVARILSKETSSVQGRVGVSMVFV